MLKLRNDFWAEAKCTVRKTWYKDKAKREKDFQGRGIMDQGSGAVEMMRQEVNELFPGTVLGLSKARRCW